jgi:hypothetical protein
MIRTIALLLPFLLWASEADPAKEAAPPTMDELLAKPLPPINVDPGDLQNVTVAAHRALPGLTTAEAEAVIGSLKRVEAMIIQLRQQAEHQAAQKPAAAKPKE